MSGNQEPVQACAPARPNDGGKRPRLAWKVLLAALFLVFEVKPAGADPVLSDPTLLVEEVVGGLSFPTTMEFLGPDDFLVLEKDSGRVRRVRGGVLDAEPVLDVAVNNRNERGLLGIAINGEDPPAVFLYYTEASGAGDDASQEGVLGNRIYRYVWNDATGRLEQGQLIVDLPWADGPNHDGGILVLDPTPELGGAPGDGRPLYAVIGDLNRDGQLQNFSGGPPPDDTGVILRLRQDGTAAAGNPFAPYCAVTTSQPCSAGCPPTESCRDNVERYFAYGIRNSFGLAIDPITGFLWDTENGPSSYDEVNLVQAGFNSGWVPIMGPDGRDPSGVDDLFDMPGRGSTYSDPEFSWLSPVAVTAILFPVGSALGPAYDDVALVGDSKLGQLYRFPLNATRTGFDLSSFSGLGDRVADDSTERDLVRLGSGFGSSFRGIGDLKLGPDGAVYVVTLSPGAVYRIRSALPPTPTPTPVPPSITGTIFYYRDAWPVSETVVALDGPSPEVTTTGANGAFAFENLSSAAWTITPSRSGGAGNAISALDAAWVLQSVAGTRTFSEEQRLACDVTGDGACSDLDAVQILQLRVGSIDRLEAGTKCASDWAFFPVPLTVPDQSPNSPSLGDGGCRAGSIGYSALAAGTEGQDFAAVLFGDCTGNWQPPAGGGGRQ